MAKQQTDEDKRGHNGGPSFAEHSLIDQIKPRMAEEYARASDAGESAAKTRLFLEQTGMNSQAFSWCKSIIKKLPKKDGVIKAKDVIRSLRAGLDDVEDFVNGYGQGELQLDVAPAPKPEAKTEEKPAAKKPAAKAKAPAKPAAAKDKPAPKKPAAKKPEPEPEPEGDGSEFIGDEDTTDFENHADEVFSGEAENIEQFDPTKVRMKG